MKNRKLFWPLLLTGALIIGVLGGCAKQGELTDVNDSKSAESTNADTTSNQSDDTDNSGASTIVDTNKLTFSSKGNDSSDAGDITIVYTNDTHSYIDNVIKDEDGNVTGDALRFSKVAAIVNNLRDSGENVILVDAGDEIQGDIYGAMDEGKTIIDIMNATGYQVATPGNHEFDYGVDTFLTRAENAQFQYVTCNFHSMMSREILFPDSYVVEAGDKKVAFVGITTPATFTSSTPAYFQNEQGEFLYAIEGSTNPQDLYISVQNAIDGVRESADYVIALGHLGVGIDEKKLGISSEDVIAHVTGLDAFIDGHSHSTIESTMIKDKSGKDVLLTQTGSYLSAVGVMKIKESGEILTSLVKDYDEEDPEVAAIEQEWINHIEAIMGEKIGSLDSTLYINSPDREGARLIRSQEMNLGDFVADSIYWFFNDNIEIDCDVVLINGGGIRKQLDAGDVSYLSAKNVEPFDDMICMISATGQQIVDALEMGVTLIGEWDDEWNIPAENGGFLQVAGLSYTVDSTIDSSVETDANGLFKSVNGGYRVSDVKIYNRENGQYEPIDLQKEYYVAGANYLLRESGNGLSMFKNDALVVDYIGLDYIILAEYIKSFGTDGSTIINTQNSPLSKYPGYLLDYENPYGAGRILIAME